MRNKEGRDNQEKRNIEEVEEKEETHRIRGIYRRRRKGKLEQEEYRGGEGKDNGHEEYSVREKREKRLKQNP